MSTTTRPAPWFRGAANPPCRVWCEGHHEADEFSLTGSLACSRTTVVLGFEFWLSQVTTVGEDAGLVDVMPQRLSGTNLDDLDVQTPELVRRYGLAVVEAASRLDTAQSFRVEVPTDA